MTRRPTWAALCDRDGVRMVDPARLAWGLRRACLDLGVRDPRAHPRHRLARRRRTGTGVAADDRRDRASVPRRRAVVLATNAFPPLLRRLRPYLVPVYDYVLMTEPLTAGPAATPSAGATGRASATPPTSSTTTGSPTTAGSSSAATTPSTTTATGSRPSSSSDRRPSPRSPRTSSTTFPQLDGVRFSHTLGRRHRHLHPVLRRSSAPPTAAGWRTRPATPGSASAPPASAPRCCSTCSTARHRPLTRLDLVRRKPLPFPPEPVRAVGINLTRWSLARADAREGRRDLWLRTLDRFGLGFDS